MDKTSSPDAPDSADPAAVDRLRRELSAERARAGRLELALRASGEGYWEWDPATDRLCVSSMLAAQLGLAGGEQWIPGRDYLRRVHPDDLAAVRGTLDRLRRAGRSGETVTLAFRIVDAAGDAHWVRACAAVEASADGGIRRIAGMHLDISEQHATEVQLETYRDELERRVAERTTDLAEARETLAQIIDNSPVPTFVLDIDHRVTRWNRACEKIIGVPAADVVGTTEQWRAFYPEPRPMLADLVMRNDPAQIEAVYGDRVRPSPVVPGAFESEDYFPTFRRWLFFTAAALHDGDGKVIGAIETLQDITARKQAEIELLEAKAVAEAAARVKAEFLANMSHEIRTPLNAIVGLARMLQKGELGSRQREQVNRLKTAGDLLQQLVSDILDFSKIEAGKMLIERTDFILDEVLDSLSLMVSETARGKGLELHFVLENDVPQHLVGDPLRLTQILVNLVGNAIKFTERGQVLVFISLAGQDEREARFEIAIQDTGIGISEEQQTRLFRAFSQADTSTTRRYGGTGLGLTICSRLVELMGGKLSLTSELGVGTTFLFQISLGIGRDSTATTVAVTGRGERVLVVDDNAIARTVLSRLLEKLGYRVDTAVSGSAALAQLAAAGDDPYRLLFLDWNMPDMNGVEVARRLRAEAGKHPLPRIIVVTSAGQSEAEAAFAEAEVNGLVQKPISASSLAAALAEPDVAAASAPPAAAPHPAPQLRGLRVLLVDDVPTNRLIVGEILDDEGARFEEAENGRIAVDKVLHGGPWDVVLMDVQMPEMDGLEATRKIRAAGPFAGLPVLAMTAFALEAEKARCLEAGMNGFLTKPVDPPLLVAALAEIVARRTPSSAPAATTVTGATPPAAGFPALPGIDTVDGLRRMMNKPAFYERMLKSFCDRFANAPATVREHLTAGRFEDARREAHSAKGVSASIGAETVRATALALEQAIAAGGTRVDAEIDAFAAALDEVFSGLRAQFGWPELQ